MQRTANLERLIGIFKSSDRSPKSIWRKRYERFCFLINPWRFYLAAPSWFRESTLWKILFKGADPLRNKIWKWKNRHYKIDRLTLNPAYDTKIMELKTNGITVIKNFVDDEQLSVLKERAEYYLRTLRGVKFVNGKPKVDESYRGTHYGYFDPEKDYQINIMGSEMEENCPLILYVLSDHILMIAAKHFGFYTRLNSVSLWLNVPTKKMDVERRSQRWHCDQGDFKMLKFYLYLDDCNLENGSFCFIPGTNYGGNRRDLVAKSGQFHSTDEMLQMIDEKDIYAVEGPASTGFFAEVSGLHRGGMTRKGHRLLLVAEFSSHYPWVQSYYSKGIPKCEIHNQSKAQRMAGIYSRKPV